jgi:L-ascorbate metabolism protein UlaG (beta-lactamase superfamily)
MHVEWFGQSAFAFRAPEASVFIDPFGDMSSLAGRGLKFEYPPIQTGKVDLILVTHEHRDHNGVEALGEETPILRSTAGRLDSPIGQVLAVASEHDDQAGTQRGPNTIFVFSLGGIRVAHFGDFGQRELRPEQAAAIGSVDLIILPVGGGPTIGAGGAMAIVQRLSPKWVVPMHYRTDRIGFLETAEEFLGSMADVELLPTPGFQTAELPANGCTAIVPAAP